MRVRNTSQQNAVKTSLDDAETIAYWIVSNTRKIAEGQYDSEGNLLPVGTCDVEQAEKIRNRLREMVAEIARMGNEMSYPVTYES